MTSEQAWRAQPTISCVKMMASCRLQVTDVYDIATKVGKEFQQIIEKFGGNCVSSLVPTVVSALEQLESYVEENQKLHAQNSKLILHNDRLAAERENRIRLAAENEVSKCVCVSVN